ncbi:M48 family metalloprotease [Pedobacter sp. LMG 31464]|uniref:M48 family metalloprotease n=1 Tax=Pedobacter planticolens TaxID=2679964 RepID=A0A923E3C1_9SPHI|nr:M56 family metallopeptidase [Pedobacter planticolens]MBB2147273.1 M48 family metalloprotease [Pedobacter planticolens]
MEAMINNLIKAIGWSILHSLWQGALIYAILFIVLMAWPKMNARLKHNLAFGSLFLIFASFCFTFFSIFELPTTNQSIESIAFNEAAYQNLSELSRNFNFKTEAYFPLVVTMYLVGIAFQLLILLSSYVKLKKLKQVNTLSVPAEWSTIFELTLTQLKINKTVKFFLSSKVNVPLVIGFFKPVVLFPIALATQLDLKQVEAILIHELSHIRRNDYLINLVKTCIETLLFFNPFVWLTTKFIHIEREHACDDLVVNFTGTPLTYAHALLKLELLKDKQTPSLSLAATGKNQHLYQRIKRITDMKTNYMNAKQQFFILTLTIATVVSLAWMNPTKKSAEKVKKATILSQIETPINETRGLKNHLIVKADTDTTKKKKQFKMVVKGNDGKEVTYRTVDDMPDSLKKKMAELEKKFNSPEWKTKMDKVKLNAEAMEKKFNSPEWKEKMAKMQENAEAIAKKFESKEWKEHMAKVQQNAEVMSKKFESKEWKDHMAKVQEQSLAIAKKFESKEWKDQMAKVKFNAEAMEKKFNSPEWKSKMADIQKNAEEMNKKFNSKEWKDKMEEMKKLQDSPEYKELRKKYEKDLEELKKAKGIKTDKALLLFDSNLDVQKAFLPLTARLATAINLKLSSPDIILETSNLKLNPINFDLAPLKLELDNVIKLKVNPKEN